MYCSTGGSYCIVALEAPGDSSFTSMSVTDYTMVSSSFHITDFLPHVNAQKVCLRLLSRYFVALGNSSLAVTTEIICILFSLSYFLEEILTSGQLPGRP